jgi:Lrp/AsnC family transcriptional regulator for asnA, asnC and gidA
LDSPHHGFAHISPNILRISLRKASKYTNSFAFAAKVRESYAMITRARQVLDDTSRAIIEQLQIDGRKPYASIGAAIGLSEAAVRQRIAKLIEAGVMQVVAVTDPLTVGAYRMAMIGLKTDGDLTAVADQLSHYKEVDYVLITSGGFDVMAEVICNDDEHLLELIQRIRAIPQVRNTESFIYLKLRKQLYNWGT